MEFLITVITAVGLVLPAINPAQPIEKHSGYAAHYSPGLMQKVAKNRGIEPQDCMLSTDLYPLETPVYVESLVDGVEVTLECLVVDHSMPKDKARHLKNKLYAELDFNSAKQICNISKVAEKPWRECPVNIWKIDP